MFTTYHKVAIRGIAATAPTTVLSNVEYAEKVSDKKYRRRILYTGIEERRMVVGGQRTSDLASIAAEAVLKRLGWKRDSVRILIFITQAPDLLSPSTAMLIQAKIGLGQDLLAYDVNLGCSGFSSGVQIMAGALAATKGRGLLLMGDCQHYAQGTEFDPGGIIFGDGGAAVAMEYDDTAPAMQCHQMTDGSRFNVLYGSNERGRVMDGNAIVLFSLNEVVDSINEFHTYFNLSRDEVDYYALHQAQKIIVEGIGQNCGLPSDKILRAYPKYGNTSSASIPFALCSNKDKLQRKALKVFTCGYGIGLAWSSALITIDGDAVLPLIESDYVYPLQF